MDLCDVLIVGGGPAGSACAWALRHAGLDVLILDAATFPRDKVCAGWITPQVVTELRIDVEEYRRGRTFQPIMGFRTGIILRTDTLGAGRVFKLGNFPQQGFPFRIASGGERFQFLLGLLETSFQSGADF